MCRRTTILLVILTFGLSGLSNAKAALRSCDKLSMNVQVELQESERHVAVYDQELRTLDSELKHHQVSAYDYQWQTQELVSYVNTEAAFQNEILKQRPLSLDVALPALPEGATKVLRTVGKYTLQVSAAVIGGILKAGGNFSP